MKKLKLKEINVKLIKNYIKILKKSKNFGKKEHSRKHLLNMCTLMLNKKNFTEDKHSRWLGYIQGVLIVYNLLEIKKERKISRKLYQKYYKENNIKQKKISA